MSKNIEIKHKQIIIPNHIPPMTHPLSVHWDQPPPDEILIDDTYALITEKDFRQLKDYSLSQPSGVYPGKMWKCQDDFYDPQNDKWFLCWYGFSEKGENFCSNNYRQIIIVEPEKMQIMQIDRSMENAEEDPEVLVIFDDGEKIRFWRTGLTDEEYFKRAKIIRALSNN